VATLVCNHQPARLQDRASALSQRANICAVRQLLRWASRRRALVRSEFEIPVYCKKR